MPSSPLISLVLCLALVGCASSRSAAPPSAPSMEVDARLLAFLDDAFDASAALSPETLTGLGLKKDQDRLDDYSEAGTLKVLALAEAQLARLKREFPYETLSPASKLSYRLFESSVEQRRLRTRWRSHQFPVTNSGSPMSAIPVFLINQHRVTSVADAEAYIARLKDVDRVMGEVSTRMREQADRGILPPRFVFDPVLADTRKMLMGAPFNEGVSSDHVLLADFGDKLALLKLPYAEHERLKDEARAALTGPFRRGYARIITTLEELAPRARGKNDGAWSLPEGEAYYADMLRYSTTTSLTPEQIHAVGLAEVARIHGEMAALQAKVGFSGTLREFFDFVERDPRFHYPNTDAGRQAYLADAKALIAQVMAAAPRLFHRLPKASLEVKAVERWRQTTAGVAFYNGPVPDGSVPGIYYVNLSDMRQVLKPQLEAISYHEGAPGHHFQIAFSQELQGLPKFRRFGFYGAFTEGWGLYAEKLGRELGFYQDPYADFGRLSLELWRATRLVVDTGLHAKRWTREQAIAYFQENTLLSDRDVVKEVERYIVWPGQATSYKTGELRILELRARAERELGARFDVRDFHEVVLGQGALPLEVLTEQVEQYIASKRGS